MPAGTDGFIADVLQNRFNRAILQRLGGLKLPDTWLVAGCLFQTVWNLRSGHAAEAGIRDYDIFYFDDSDLSAAAEERVNQRAALLFADLGVPLEIKNQARVHTWYQDYFGRPYTALGSSREGIDRFLVACTSVGIRARSDPAGDGFEVYAPHGLNDLYHGVLRPNPTLDHGALFEPKCRDYQARWPWLTIQPNARE
ncbi:MAG: nucleotidyltransferase family protein [Rhodoferax sp.]|uniref:nucleotidyltransferase family protein n=1 Tax=Rhodoferax sp. TaxID=50421 RepID=UPI002613FF48|nr:nucleotidyltransferase family protein [Rhodoferax sp.]MDD5334798.1 nucleotidyltransferase family protein [Rhodoferax sp.]